MHSCALPQCDVGNTFKVEQKVDMYRLETPVTFSGTQQQVLYLLVDLIQVIPTLPVANHATAILQN